MTLRESIAAGAAIGAARDANLDETGQATAAIIAAKKIQEEDAKKASPIGTMRMPADSLDLPAVSAKRQAEPLLPRNENNPHHKPARPPKVPFILKLAHWLNLK